MKKIFLLIYIFSCPAFAKINVVTTLTDLRAIAAEVGGAYVNTESLAKGTQDPHFIEAKPSYMIKVSQADLLISVGLDLEVGWLPSLMQGARNPKINRGQLGFLELGPKLQPLEVANSKLSRSEGDVHPDGNPHVTLDPHRASEIAILIAQRLGELDSAHTEEYLKNAKSLQARLESKIKVWQMRLEKTSQKKIVSFHKTLTYFFDRFKIENPAILEPKPGLPPTSGHILEVIDLMKKQKINLILVENYFDATVTNKMKQDLPTLRVESVAVSVDGSPNVKQIDDLYESLVTAIEGRK